MATTTTATKKRASKKATSVPPAKPLPVRATMTYADWTAEAARRFGADSAQWRFVCPVCGHIAAVADWKAAGAPEGALAFSCVGRWIEGAQAAFLKSGKGPCNYTGGGLFKLNPVTVTGNGADHHVFAFAEASHV